MADRSDRKKEKKKKDSGAMRTLKKEGKKRGRRKGGVTWFRLISRPCSCRVPSRPQLGQSEEKKNAPSQRYTYTAAPGCPHPPEGERGKKKKA